MRLRRVNFSQVRSESDKPLNSLYFDVDKNKKIFFKVAHKCYYPTNNILLKLIDELGDKFKFTFSRSGVFIDQCKKFDPDLLDSFRKLADTGSVEFLAETYYHSLAGLMNEEEFRQQVIAHSNLIKDELGFKPRSFRNTELLMNNSIAKVVEDLGFKAVLAEGVEWLLKGRSPNQVYTVNEAPSLRILLRNYQLSDDIGYRFSAKWWREYPLTADKYAAWLSATPGKVINLFMDYETFGEHHWEDSGIFWFLKALPSEVLKYKNLEFSTVSEAADIEPAGQVSFDKTISWADLERDESAWLGNEMQKLCFNIIKDVGPIVKESGNQELLRAWRLLQTSDHFYYLCTKSMDDGDVHTYFSPFNNPNEAFMNFSSILFDFKARAFKDLLMKKDMEIERTTDQLRKLEARLWKVQENFKPSTEKKGGLFGLFKK